MYSQEDIDLFNLQTEKATNYKNSISSNKKDWIYYSESKLKIGDIIFVEYLPCSQKYIYYHYPECGVVQTIDTNTYYSAEDVNKTELCIKILNSDKQLININKEHLSMFSRGYDTIILKYQHNENNDNDTELNSLSDDCFF